MKIRNQKAEIRENAEAAGACISDFRLIRPLCGLMPSAQISDFPIGRS
jgi:hypothetical protein